MCGVEGEVQDSCEEQYRVQLLERLQNPRLYKIVIQRKRKQGEYQSSDLGTKESRVTSKNGFDVKYRKPSVSAVYSQRHCQGKGNSRARPTNGSLVFRQKKNTAKTKQPFVMHLASFSLFLQNLIASEI